MITNTQAIFDGYVPSNLLAKDLGLEAKDFRGTTLPTVKFKAIVLVKIPLSAVKFIISNEYTSALLDAKEKEDMYDYVLTVSPKIKVGFWR